jgi:pilus assembly protein CpaB
MRGKSLLAFALAIGCGLVAMVGVQQVLKKQTANPDADKVTVFVAATEIMPGQTLDMNMLEKRKFLKGSVPKEAVIDPKQLEKRALTCKVMPGDIIRSDKLGAEGKTGASISIPKGMRVVSLPTNTTQAHSGMLQAGDRVDVMVSYRVHPPQGGGRDYPETKTILGFIQVFATDAVRDSTAASDGGKASAVKNVSLLVTPEQAQVLMMAQSVGTLHLSLRNAGDAKEVDITNLTPDEFRDSVVLNGHAVDEPDPSKQDPPRATAQGEPSNDLNNFLDEASGKPGQREVAAAAPESTTEPWEIAFYNKAGVTVEKLEVPRRPVAPKTVEDNAGATRTPNTVMGTLLNILQSTKDAQREAQKSDAARSESAKAPDSKKSLEAKPAAATRTRDDKSAQTNASTNKTSKASKQLPSKALTSSLGK